MKILVTGSSGQIGSELVPALRERYGKANVVSLDIKSTNDDDLFEKCDVTNKEALSKIIKKHEIDTIYHLVGILSATGEKHPSKAWDVNAGGLKIMLDLAVEYKIKKMFWPSSIAAFGPSAKKQNTPQDTMLDPFTIYGVSKVAGELLCNYYHVRWGLDVRSLRYPGIISSQTLPGGGTTDYAVEIFYDALRTGKYECFLKEDAMLPMMHMPDVINATIQLMEAPEEQVKIRTSYNIAAISFTPRALVEEIQKQIPLKVSYVPDQRQKIADSWPDTINDTPAREDWGWEHKYTLPRMVEDMLVHLRKRLNI